MLSHHFCREIKVCVNIYEVWNACDYSFCDLIGPYCTSVLSRTWYTHVTRLFPFFMRRSGLYHGPDVNLAFLHKTYEKHLYSSQSGEKSSLPCLGLVNCVRREVTSLNIYYTDHIASSIKHSLSFLY